MVASPTLEKTTGAKFRMEVQAGLAVMSILGQVRDFRTCMNSAELILKATLESQAREKKTTAPTQKMCVSQFH